MTLWETTIGSRLRDTDNRPSGFDYMRIILALSVILQHTVNASYGGKAAFDFFHTPARAVFAAILPMFFSLSGFLIASSLERSKTIISFICLRILRIVPALAVEVFLSALVLGPVLTTLPLHDYFADSKFRSYFLNILGDIHYDLPGMFLSNPVPNTVNGQLWTVPFELYCYATLTVLALVGLVRRRGLFLLALIATQTGLVVYILLNHIPYYPVVRGPLLILCFLCGLAIYLFRDSIIWNRNLFFAALALTAGLLLIPPRGDFVVCMPVAYVTVYLGLCNPRKWSLIATGDYSYGAYLYGFPLQQTFASLGEWTHHWYLNFIAAVPCALGVAVCSWHFIEKPALRLRRYIVWLEENLTFKRSSPGGSRIPY